MHPDQPVRDWKKIVADSGGLQQFMPTALMPAAKAWQEKRLAFTKRVNEIAKMENEVSLAFTTLVFDIRKHFETAGVDGPWTMDIGIETAALKDGEFVLNLTPNQK